MKRELSDVEERLRDWGSFFRDRHRLMRCGSAEGRFKPHSDDFAIEGWGEPEKPPARPIRRRDWVLLALQTNDAIMQLNNVQKWSITYAYAYPGLPKHVVLRCLKKWTGRHVTWRLYTEQVEVGKYRVEAILR